MIRSFKSIIQTYSGKDKSIKKVFVTPHNKEFSRLRQYVYPTLGAHHHQLGTKFKNAVMLWKVVSPDFKKDLEIYTKHYNKKYQSEMKSNLSAYNLFIKVLCKHPTPIENLTGTDSVEQIFGTCILEWMVNGLLPLVKDEKFQNAGIA